MWKKYKKIHKEKIRKFFIEHEYFCISIFERISFNDKVIIDKCIDSLVFYEDKDENINSIIFYKNGFLFPILNQDGILEQKSWTNLLEIDYIFLIMGRQKDVVAISGHINYQIRNTIEYFTMNLKKQNLKIFEKPKELTKASLEFATSLSISKLFNIQKNYMEEEVVLDPNSINSLMVINSINKNISSDRLMFLEYEKKPIAKSSINCIGINYCQLGGVYTEQAWRRHGLSKYVVSNICDFFCKKGYDITLFVKQKNTPAINLYTELGFEKNENFSIYYYLS